MPLNKEDLSFKKLISKEFTNPSRQFFQEVTTATLDISSTDIYSNVISSSTASAILDGYAKQYTLFTLTPDPTYPTTAWYFCSGSGFTPGTSTYDATKVQRNFISDKYGTEYEIKLYDNSNNQIFKTDAINWYFDYKTGILAVSDPGAYTTPYKVSVIQYIGDTLNTTLTDLSSSIGGGSGFPFSGSAVITGSLLISGSNVNELVVSGNVIATQGFTGSLSGNATSATSATNAEQAQTVAIVETNDNQNYYLPFTNVAGNNYGNLYQDTTGSFVYNPLLNTLKIGGLTNGVTTGSIQLTGSINMLSGSITLNSGSFIGTSSWALSASNTINAITASVAQSILPTNFIFTHPSSINITGSGLVISASSLPANHYNAIKIGNSELADGYTSLGTVLILSESLYIAKKSGQSGSEAIAQLFMNNFEFGESASFANFRSNATNFTVFKSGSAEGQTAFDINRQTGLLYASGGASISGSTNIQNNLTVGDTLTAGTSSLANLTVTNNATITGNLTVNGTTTYVNVQDLLVEDKFILLNSGSTGGVPNEGGIIVQTTSSNGVAYGTALYYDQEANRWIVNRSSSVAWNVTSSVFSFQSDFIVTVTGSDGAPTGTPVNFGTGNSLNSIGQMYINTSNSDIYIYA